MSVLWNPMPVHRIDKATSGLLVVAKTKPAMVHLSHQFRERKVKKTCKYHWYTFCKCGVVVFHRANCVPWKDTAIVNGIPPEPKESSITSAAAKHLGVCIGTANDTGDVGPMWQLIDKDLEGQSAVTIWRVLGNSTLENAMNETITMVELKPKTGRFHQLRRHMVSDVVKESGDVYLMLILSIP